MDTPALIPQPEVPVKPGRNILGGISFGVGLTLILAWLIALSMLRVGDPPGILASIRTIAYYLALWSPAIGLAGLILGIIGVFQKTRPKGFAIAGIVLNFFPMTAWCAIYLFAYIILENYG